jgi:proline iminopeptidase
MLPSHLLDATKKRNERPNHTRLGQAPPAPLPSLCVTGAMSQIGRYQVAAGGDGVGSEDDVDNQSIFLSYIIFRPRQLHDTKKPPLLCLHGGPSIPSNYLLPIVNGVTDRTVIFYDQWGCGKSSRPRMTRDGTIDGNGKSNSKQSKMAPFSIPIMVEHLRQLVERCWKINQFHLLGHSFGGILAFEYLKLVQREAPPGRGGDECFVLGKYHPEVLSLILSSAPTSAALVQTESNRLYENLRSVSLSSRSPPTDDQGKPNIDDDGAETSAGDDTNDGTDGEKDGEQLQLQEEFAQTHECRLSQPPLALTDALAQAGPTPWRGIPAISEYQASGTIAALPTLLLRGEYDFCTEVCMDGWKERIAATKADQQVDDPTLIQTETLSNCSHYAMLEDERQYGKALSRFIQEHDPV